MLYFRHTSEVRRRRGAGAGAGATDGIVVNLKTTRRSWDGRVNSYIALRSLGLRSEAARAILGRGRTGRVERLISNRRLTKKMYQASMKRARWNFQKGWNRCHRSH